MSSTKHVVCPGCTLLCDDIEIRHSGPHVIATHACEKGQEYFKTPIDEIPRHTVSHKPVDLDAAILAAAKILARSKSPLIGGLDHLTTEAQQSAWKLADQIGATIDTTFSNSGRSSMFALQRIGKVTASLGEIANRSDLIVFWFCDPETTHPRLLERLNKSPDRPRRRIVVVDETETRTAKLADSFLRVDGGSCPAILATLRATFAGTRIHQPHMPPSSGLESQAAEELARLFGEARYGSIFFGQTTTNSGFDLATDSLHQLIRKLNDVTRFVGMKLRTDGNAQSAENVLAWSSGYPFAVSHGLNYPRFNGLEYSAETILSRRQCDAILLVTDSDIETTLAGLPPAARDHLRSIPKISLSRMANDASDVAIQVGFPGLNESGEFCRIDDVSLPLMNTRSTPGLSTAEILDRIRELYLENH